MTDSEVESLFDLIKEYPNQFDAQFWTEVRQRFPKATGIEISLVAHAVVAALRDHATAVEQWAVAYDHVTMLA